VCVNMADKVAQNETNVANINSDLNSLCDSSTKLAVFKGDSPEDITERLRYLQSVPMEELMKIAEAQMIEGELKNQLEIKHQQELLEHVLRQHEEMRELKNQLRAMNLEEGSEAIMLSSTGQSDSLDSLVIPQVIEKDGRWQSVGSEKVLDAPLSPALSPLVGEVSVGESCGEEEDGTFVPDSKMTTFGPLELPNEDYTYGESESMQCGKWKLKGNPLKQVASAGNLKIPKLTQPQYELQKGQLSSFQELPNGSKFNTHLFKTEICRRWTQMGFCPWGGSCRFAHGAKELRMRPIMHRKFKTVRCRKYLAGYCPYGSRCCFVHDISEQRMTFSERSNYLPSGRDETQNWAGRSYVHGGISPTSMRDMDMRRRRSRPVTTHPSWQQRI